MAKAVVLFSGGLDSTTLLYKTIKQRHDQPIALSFDYGQRHRRELANAQMICRELGVEHTVAELPWQIFIGSSLTGKGEVPQGHYADSTMKATIVPNRNAVFLSLGFALAESRNASYVAYAAHAGDHPVYPDCRPEFMDAFATMEHWALGHAVELYTPFAYKSKGEIVREGSGLGIDYAYTWSCYEGGTIHCGKCGTCVERKEAFQLAGIADPTDYADPEFEIAAYRG